MLELIQRIIFYGLYFILFYFIECILLVNILNILNKFGFNVYDMTPYTTEDIFRFPKKPATSIFLLEEESSGFLRIVDKFMPDYMASRGPDMLSLVMFLIFTCKEFSFVIFLHFYM